jgi:glutathione peroxidase
MIRMKDVFALGASLMTLATGCGQTVQGVNQDKSALRFKMESLDGEEVDLSQYEGKVVLIVNVASKCGLTPQYEQLQKLHEKYADQGLAILGFPCNQFLGQEPGSAEEIAEFCKKNYGVDFDMFAKVDVKGEEASDLYKLLTSLDTKPTGAGDISWNFEKFVLDRNGFVVGRFSPRTKPDAPEVVELIEAQLKREPKAEKTTVNVGDKQ